MSLFKMLEQIETAGFNEEQQEQMVNRKKALGSMGNFAKNMAMAAVPLGAITAFASTPAEAQSATQDMEILNYALQLEYLEMEFYDKGVAAMQDGSLPNDNIEVFKKIKQHEDAHVAFLKSALGSKAQQPLSHDYTANGSFDPFNKNGTGKDKAYAQFRIISQGFEDTGVRAYKGQAPRLMSTDLLQAALQIHSVEARHAAAVRKLRGKVDMKTLPWIIGDGKYAPKPIKGVYGADKKYKVSEGNTKQAGVDVSKFVSTEAGTAAFDEPLDMDYVLHQILPPFVPDLRS
jgi:rubrerythrin